jgi:hypothetical protein
MSISYYCFHVDFVAVEKRKMLLSLTPTPFKREMRLLVKLSPVR